MPTSQSLACLLLPTMLYIACQQKPKSQATASMGAWQKGLVSATDSLAYGSPFLHALAAANYPDSIWLTADLMLIGKNDTVWLPIQSKADSLLLFSGEFVQIQVSRLNRTTFQLLATSPSAGTGVQKVWWNGPVVLQPLFFLGAEVQEDPNSGDPVGMCTYTGTQPGQQANLLLSVEPSAPHWARLTITSQQNDSVLLQSGMIKQR